MSEQEEFSLEDSLGEIRDILDKMQKGVSDFDRQMELFKRGNALVEACRNYLDGAEMSIKQLVEGELEDFESND